MRLRKIILIVVLLVAYGEVIHAKTGFVDARLEAAIRESLGRESGPLSERDLASIRRLDIRSRGIEHLDGIEALRGLRVLRANENRIRDLAPLARLTGLIRVDLIDNLVEDVSPLAGLTNLRILKLDRNRIRDLGPISDLDKLTRLTAEGNPLTTHLDLPALYKALRTFQLDESAIVDVSDLTIRKDVASFYLSEGTIYMARRHPVGEDSVRTGALFVGKGRFEMEPPTCVEREQLARFRGAERLSERFEVLFLRFTDASLDLLLDSLATAPRKVPGRVRREANYARNYTAGDDRMFLAMVEDIATDTDDGFFYAHMGKRMSTSAGYLPKPDFFIFAPRRVEEVRFEARRPSTGRDYLRQVICQFHRQEDYASGEDLSNETKTTVEPTHYAGQFDVSSGGDLSGHITVDLRVAAAKVHALTFWLHPKLELESITWAGRPAMFDTRRSTSTVVVFLDPPAFVGSSGRLDLTYSGQVLTREEGTFYMHSSGLWYPRFPGIPTSTFDLTFSSPASYDFIAAGEKTEDHIEGKKRITRWLHRTPAVNTSFNMGSFTEYKLEEKGHPPVAVHMSERGHAEIIRRLEREGMSTGRNMEKEIAGDIANSVKLFSRLFGPYPYKGLVATEIPWSHGEAFPGFLHLSIATFLLTDEKGEGIAFRAHEVAHQWWGTTLRFKTYHDQWLSEGFAEYSGLWYVQAAMGDNETFFKLLEDWRDRIFSNRKYVLGSGTEAGPIWLGRRTQTSETEGDYGLIIYKKGAYVLHMLRNMFLDLNTLTDTGFADTMHEFFTRFKDRPASTEDFRRIVEKRLGEDLGWFFDQWVYGTDLPTYRFEYREEQTEEGGWNLRCRVRQYDVPETFRMYVPVTVRDVSGAVLRTRILVDRPEVEFEVGPLNAKPSEVTFNDFFSVLAMVKS